MPSWDDTSSSDDNFDEEYGFGEFAQTDDASNAYIIHHEGDAVFVIRDVNPEEQDAFIVKGTVTEAVWNNEKNVNVYLRENIKDTRDVPMSDVFDNLDNAEEFKEKLVAKRRPKTPPRPPPMGATPPPSDSYSELPPASRPSRRRRFPASSKEAEKLEKEKKKGVAGTGLTTAQIRAKVKAKKEEIRFPRTLPPTA